MGMNTGRCKGLAVAVLWFSACDGITNEPFEYGRVTVEVTLPDGTGLPDVGLTLYTGTRHLGYAVTDVSGGARFDFVPEGAMGVTTAPNSEYRPVAHPKGYFATVYMREGEHVTIPFAFVSRRGTIALAIRDAVGDPRPDHEVELYNPWEVVVRTRTNTQGEMLFEGLMEGDYGIRVFESATCALRPDGYMYETFRVNGGARVEGVITLASCGPGTIALTVRDAAGNPRPDQEVELYNSREALLRTRTGTQGEVLFEKIPSGEYGIRVFESATCRLPPEGYVYRDGLRLEPVGRLDVVITLAGC